MRFMIIVKASKESEAGVLPDEKILTEMGRFPFQEGDVEIRQVFEAEDFGPALKPEFREQEERLRAQAAKKR